MDEKLTALKLFLDELDVSHDITTVDDRKRVQKAVYLGQLSGLDLGYRFGWYLMGPYSPGLTRDYFQLAVELETQPTEFKKSRLRKEAAERLHRVRSLFEIPHSLRGVLELEDWLELLASYHYLRVISQQHETQAKSFMNERKPRLVTYIPEAKKALRSLNLLPA